MTSFKRDIIVIVDSFTSRQYYVPAFVGRGYRCIHVDVYSSKSNANNLFEELFFKTIKVEDENNIDDVIKEIKKYSVLAVLAGLEASIKVADSIADHFDVPKNNFKTTKYRTNKFYMNEALQKSGIPCVKQIKSNNVDKLVHWFEKSESKKMIIKPTESALSEGVSVCESAADIRDAFNKHINKKNILGKIKDEFVLQDYLYGREYIVNTVSYEGQHFVTDIWLGEFEDNYSFSLDLYASLVDKNSEEYSVLSSYIKTVLDAVELKNGPAHCEVKYTKEGPRLIEINARLAGALDWYAMELALGYSQLSVTVDTVLNPKLFFSRTQSYKKQPQKQMRFVYFYSEQEGEVVREPNLDSILALPTLKSAIFIPKLGEKLVKTRDTFGHPGYASFIADSLQEIERDYLIFRQLEKEMITDMIHPKRI